MKKLLATLLCIGALVGLPGCGGKKSYYDENRMECHDEMQDDGSMKRVCSDGNVVTVYEGVEGKRGKHRGKGERTVPNKAVMVNKMLPEGTPVKPCGGVPVWEEVATEEVKPQRRASRGRAPRKDMMQEMEME